MKTTTEIGRFGEDIACAHLKEEKYKIVERNYFASHNEIDIIAENKQYIVFVEVKTRSCTSPDDMMFGTPATAVTAAKQKRTLIAAQAYLNTHRTSKMPRLDVIEVYLSKSTASSKPELIKINHMENAFTN
jgi:putative endonuclease